MVAVVNSIAVDPKVAITDINITEDSTVKELFNAIKYIIKNSDIEINVSLADVLNEIEQRLDRCEVSIGNLNNDLNILTEEFTDSKSNIENSIAELSSDYHKFVDHTFVENGNEHISSYNMIITDEEHKGDDIEPSGHDQYIMTFQNGTIVLIKK